MANAKEFPLIVDMLPAAQELIDWLTGSSTLDTHCLAWDGWTVQGFIMGQIWKHPAHERKALAEALAEAEVRITFSSAAGPTNAEKADELRKFVEKCKQKTGDAGPVGMDIPWVAIWLLVRDLIDQLLGV